MATNRYCDGVQRRDFIKVGALGGLGLNLAGYLKMSAAGEVSANTRAKSAIVINLQGGPTHMDTFDLKPDAPAEYRGDFKPVATNVPGMEICEHLPKLAKCADKYVILRGVSHSVAAHELGQKYMHTGNRPTPALEYPGIGSVVAKEFGSMPDLPGYVAIPSTNHRAGYLGVQYAAFQTNSTPLLGKPFQVRGISVAGGVTIGDIEKRQTLLQDLDKTIAVAEANSDLINGLDQFSHQAHQIITSKRARDAFDLSKENVKLSESFGNHAFGQSCLLATRLVEAGVRFVTVSHGGWDTHGDNFTQLKNGKCGVLDDGLAGLFTTLAERGLLESTAVYVTGEFGRTPKINAKAGRDHWPRAMFVLMAGGGMKMGQVIGASDAKGEGPANKAITPEMVAGSLYKSLGIDYSKEYHTPSGRPVMIIRDGNIVEELF